MSVPQPTNDASGSSIAHILGDLQRSPFDDLEGDTMKEEEINLPLPSLNQ